MTEEEKKALVSWVGNVFGLQDQSYYVEQDLFPLTSQYEKEGAYHWVAREWIAELSKSYKISMSDFSLNTTEGKDILDAFSHVFTLDRSSIISMHDENNINVHIDRIIQLIKQKKPVIIHIGYLGQDSHAWYIGICPDKTTGKIKLISSNRGIGGENIGINVWMTDLNEELLRYNGKQLKQIFQDFLTNSPIYYENADVATKQRLNLLRSMATGSLLPFSHKFSAQQNPNCAVANAKPMFFAFLELMYPDLSKEKKLAMYKDYTTYFRRSIIHKLINDIYTSTYTGDREKQAITKEMLLAIMIKLLVKFRNKKMDISERFLNLLIYLMEKLDLIGLSEELYNKLFQRLSLPPNYINFYTCAKTILAVKKFLNTKQEEKNLQEIKRLRQDIERLRRDQQFISNRNIQLLLSNAINKIDREIQDLTRKEQLAQKQPTYTTERLALRSNISQRAENCMEQITTKTPGLIDFIERKLTESRITDRMYFINDPTDLYNYKDAIYHFLSNLWLALQYAIRDKDSDFFKRNSSILKDCEKYLKNLLYKLSFNNIYGIDQDVVSNWKLLIQESLGFMHKAKLQMEQATSQMKTIRIPHRPQGPVPTTNPRRK